MNTNTLTIEQITAIATQAAVAAVQAAMTAHVDLAEVPVTAPEDDLSQEERAEDAYEAKIQAGLAKDRAQELPVLTRARWNTIRRTKAGSVRKAFAGLTREQAHEAGLCEGYRLPTGAMRASLGA